VTNPQANKGGVANIWRDISTEAGGDRRAGRHAERRAHVREGRAKHRHGQASDEVKKKADFVTDSYEDEGFAKAIEKYFLAG